MYFAHLRKASGYLTNQQWGHPLPLCWDGPFLQRLLDESKRCRFKPRRSRFLQLLDNVLDHGENYSWRGQEYLIGMVTRKYPEVTPLYWPTLETELERLQNGTFRSPLPH